MSTEQFLDLTEKSAKSQNYPDHFNTPSSNPDYTVGFGVAPNQHFCARGLYRRSGITPCPEGNQYLIDLFIIICKIYMSRTKYTLT